MEIGNQRKLDLICRYACTVYAYAWLQVTQYPSIVDGSRNFVKFMAANQQFFREEKWENEIGVSLHDRMGDIFEGNSYWLHEENILVSMLYDENSDVRQKAVDTVMSIRKYPRPKGVRIFKPPPIDWERDWSEVIGKEWKVIEELDPKNMTEPPVFMRLTDDELQSAVDDPVLKLSGYPQHTQSTERMVQKMAKASSYLTFTISA